MQKNCFFRFLLIKNYINIKIITFNKKYFIQIAKTEKSKNEKILDVIEKYPNEFKRSVNGDLYYKFCKTIVSFKRNSIIDTHRNSKKHQKSIENEGSFIEQTFLDNSPKKISKFTAITKDFLKQMFHCTS